ncbi:hypothetical protein [Amycolatopsis vastitatis]|uniref:Uncharacterized protein n=1 Tax=Amycolatopsis vastitatis TaxID=1905142 RepID=A0A229TCA9_9PSEU|nr:hypothetical protein [Amycolatopsis vastitatis]OXM68892.1 hypothetical protein CF165_12535 [Amycolatopsis vastitatis]
MAPPLTGVRRVAAVTAGLLAFAVAACSPPSDRHAGSPGKAHGVAVDGRVTTPAGGLPGVRETRGSSPAPVVAH